MANQPEIDEAKRRELFTGHLTALFPEYAWQITEFAVGAEEQVDISPGTGEESVTGRIDTRKGALLIEYKRDLSKRSQRDKAEDQLKGYIAGIINNEGPGSISKCLASDIERWREYDFSVTDDAEPGSLEADDIELSLVGTDEFTPSEADEFPETVQRLVFEDVPVVATGPLLAQKFGLDSERYLDFRSDLDAAWESTRESSQAQLGLKLWSEYVENCFEEETDPDEETYLDHVYLVILARLIAGSAIASPAEQAQDDFPQRCVTGEFFEGGVHRVDRFVEEDFFRWAKAPEVLDDLESALDDLHLDLQRLDFRAAKKHDLLQELYQQIMPPERQAEYGGVFTPTALVQAIVNELQNVGEEGVKVLDPACGTGSFLRAVVERKLDTLGDEVDPQDALESVLADVTGLDVNPVSVIIAKTTLMLTLSDLLHNSDRPVEIPVYLCDSLFLPDEFVQEDAEEVTVSFDDTDLTFPSELFAEGTSAFDTLVHSADQLASQIDEGYLDTSEAETLATEKAREVGEDLDFTDSQSEALEASTTELVHELYDRIQSEWNNVWAFVLENTYRPAMLEARFDVIVSNPPWLAMSSFPAARYREQLEELIESYQLTPEGESKHHIEIATVFAIHCVTHYLSEDAGDFAFVLPRVILNGDQHDPFRRSEFAEEAPFQARRFWDLEDVDGLFKRPACVLFGQCDWANAGLPEELLRAVFTGDRYTLHGQDGDPLILSTLGPKSAYDTEEEELDERTYYLDRFREGADLMPKQAVMVDILGKEDATIVSIETAEIERENPNAKIEMYFEGVIERDYLFSTLQSKAVMPFVYGDFTTAALPVEVAGGSYHVVTASEMVQKGDVKAKEWFEKVNKELEEERDKTLVSWLGRRNKLTNQSAESCEHAVVYGAGGKNIAAAVVDTSQATHPFINDQTLYMWEAEDEAEAWYVCGMLNSDPLNEAIKSKQAKGDFGEQHIHKLPLRLIPRFDPSDSDHQKVVDEAQRLAEKAIDLCEDNPEYLDQLEYLPSRRRSFDEEISEYMEDLNTTAANILGVGDGDAANP